MNISKTSIVIASLIAAASAALATAASAQNPERLSDVAFIAASRCEGLAQGAKVDTTAIKSLLVNQDNDRNSYIEEKASEARDNAKRLASHAQGFGLETVNSELNGPCQAYLKS